MVIDRTADEKKATYGFALWFLCPLVIYTSAVHGMFDTISVLFMVLAVYSLHKGHDFLAGASLSVAILLKMFPAYLAFVLIAYLALKHRGDVGTLMRRISMAALGLGMMALVIFMPQILDGTVAESLKFITGRIAAATGFDGGAGDAVADIGFKIVLWLQPIIFVLLAAFAYLMYRGGGKDNEKAFFTCLMITTAAIFLWPAEPQFLLVPLPFLICFAVMFDKRFIIPFVLISTGALVHDLACHNFSVLMSLAAYTDILDISTVVSLVEWTQQPFVLNFTRHYVLMAVAAATEMIGIFMVLWFWIRYEKEAKANA
jgi:hypothetical protein